MELALEQKGAKAREYCLPRGVRKIEFEESDKRRRLQRGPFALLSYSKILEERQLRVIYARLCHLVLRDTPGTLISLLLQKYPFMIDCPILLWPIAYYTSSQLAPAV